jgi:indolepyruvate ferredoxin oxidoreductase
VLGKFDDEGEASGGEWSHAQPQPNWLLRAKADLTPALIAKAIAKRLKKLGVDADIAARMDERLAVIEAKEPPGARSSGRPATASPGSAAAARTTPAPRARGLARHGRHRLPLHGHLDGPQHQHLHQMGGEGVPWVGQAPFTTDKHIFANLGDGTYFHSGILAIRQSIAAKVNITYKILYNDAVAMTGGQQVGERPEGRSVPQMTRELTPKAWKKIVIVTDEPEKYDGRGAGARRHGAPPRRAGPRAARLREMGLHRHHLRPDLRHREAPPPQARQDGRPGQARGHQRAGVRRLRRLRRAEQLPERGAAGDRVRPQAPHQPEHLQQGLSCVKGFCPSFVTVEGGQLKKPKKEKRGDLSALPPSCPTPCCRWPKQAWGIVVAGVGGTGVITIGQLLGMAAHLEGKGVVTQDAGGLAQKGGAPGAMCRSPTGQEAIHTTKVDTAKADLVIACDAIVAANKATLQVMQPGPHLRGAEHPRHAHRGLREEPRLAVPHRQLRAALAAGRGRGLLGRFDAEQVAVQLLGDSDLHQPADAGLRLAEGPHAAGHAALMRAIELNGVQVDNNKAAFEWGRRCAHDLAVGAGAVRRAAGHPVRQEALAGRDGGAPRGVPHRLPGRRLRGRPTRPSSRRCARPKAPLGRARRSARRWRATCSS